MYVLRGVKMQQKEPKIYYLKVVVLGDENSGKHELFDKLTYLSHFSYTYQTMRCKIGVRSLFLKDEKLKEIKREMKEPEMTDDNMMRELFNLAGMII